MTFTADDLAPFLFDNVDLQQYGSLITKLTGAEALNLCRLGMVEGRMGKARCEVSGEKVPVLRYLELIATTRRLKTVLRRVGAKSRGQVVAVDCNTTVRTKFGVFHRRDRSAAYAGGVSRLVVIGKMGGIT